MRRGLVLSMQVELPSLHNSTVYSYLEAGNCGSLLRFCASGPMCKSTSFKIAPMEALHFFFVTTIDLQNASSSSYALGYLKLQPATKMPQREEKNVLAYSAMR